ncbi:TolC family protein [Pontiella agarivorans]|uniref:TolC family protein n=1 Tax=Pontiella agarivorans TaxID=3038953 RepID=A0ABU5MX70_9BACT|nr:TolC family protein [Pontiella agarivorans]MDZ8118806.1 TolC family protein [Pontiella agarivorans]
MKKWILFALLFPMLGTAQTNGLSLAEVRQNVLKGNPSVREAVQRIAAAEAVQKQARSAYLPTVTLSASYGHVDASLHPDSDPETRYGDSFMQGTGGLQANWLLFDGFAREARSLAAKYGVQQSHEFAAETRRLLIQSATVAYRQAQLARENVAIAERDLAFNRNLEADAKKRFDAGALPESDVHNFSIRALQAETSELRAELNYNTACAMLAELMALPEARLPQALQPVPINFDETGSIPELESEFRYALTHRPDYQALTSGQFALVQQTRAAKGEMMPKVFLSGEMNYADRSGYADAGDHGNYDSFAGVTASWDLFAGGRKTAVVKQAQADLRALEEQQESLSLSIRSSLQQRIDEAEVSKAIFRRSEKIHALSVQVRDSVEKSYKAGMESITRLNEAQTDLVRARGSYTTAYIAYQLVLNQLDIETGRILSELE